MSFITNISVNNLYSVIINSTSPAVFHKVSDTSRFLRMLNIWEMHSLGDLSGCQCCEYKVKEKECAFLCVWGMEKKPRKHAAKYLFWPLKASPVLKHGKTHVIQEALHLQLACVVLITNIFFLFLQYAYTYRRNCLLALCPEQNNYWTMLQSLNSN